MGCPWKEHGAHRLDAYEGLGSLSLLIKRIAHVKHIITRKLSKDMIESSTAIGMDFAKPRSPYNDDPVATTNYKRSSHG